jgi:hypothetical protein
VLVERERVEERCSIISFNASGRSSNLWREKVGDRKNGEITGELFFGWKLVCATVAGLKNTILHR